MSDHAANLLLQGSDSYDDLKTRITGSPNLFVLDFFAPWCGPCQRLVSELPKLATEFPNVTFIKINVDDCKTLAGQFGVSSIPHLHFVKGKGGDIDKLEQVVGFNMGAIKANIAKHT